MAELQTTEMSKRCSWVNCQGEARHPRRNAAGEVWSNVCDEHDKEMKTAAIEAFNTGGSGACAKKLASMWVKAQGGAKKAADRACGGSL